MDSEADSAGPGDPADAPFVTDPDAGAACWVCPSLRLPRAAFTTADRPSQDWPFSPADGYRYLADGTPGCVHPGRLGLTAEHTAPPPPPLEQLLAPGPRQSRFGRSRPFPPPTT